MGVVGIALRGFGKALGKLAKKKKKKTFLDRESKVVKRIKQRKRDDAVFKGVMGAGAVTGYAGVKIDSELKDKERRRKYPRPRAK